MACDLSPPRLARRASEVAPRLRRLHDAIESGVADITCPMLKERIEGKPAPNPGRRFGRGIGGARRARFGAEVAEGVSAKTII